MVNHAIDFIVTLLKMNVTAQLLITFVAFEDKAIVRSNQTTFYKV